MNKTQSKISIVTTLYRSERYVEEFYKRAVQALEKITDNYEVVFVDDGSPDSSGEVAQKLEGPVRVVRFSKNFGHHTAMMAACEHATGDYIFLIDSDLEENPELLAEFWEELQKDKNLDVCYGVQSKRKGGFLERMSGGVFYRLFNALSDIKVPENLLTVRLMTRRYVDALLLHREKELFIAGLWARAGFNQKPIVVKKLDKGETTYRFSQKIGLLVNSLTSFSQKPLIMIFQLGILVLLMAFGYSCYAVYLKVMNPSMPLGYPSLMISIWLFGGLILFCLGILGIYMAKLFGEVKNRPLYVVKEISDKTVEDKV